MVACGMESKTRGGACDTQAMANATATLRGHEEKLMRLAHD
jgi:hypothetical protein